MFYMSGKLTNMRGDLQTIEFVWVPDMVWIGEALPSSDSMQGALGVLMAALNYYVHGRIPPLLDRQSDGLVILITLCQRDSNVKTVQWYADGKVGVREIACTATGYTKESAANSRAHQRSKGA